LFVKQYEACDFFLNRVLPVILEQQLTSPAVKASLERRLTIQSGSLQGMQERVKELEHQRELQRLETASQQKRLKERDERLNSVETERDQLELKLATYVNDINVTI